MKILIADDASHKIGAIINTLKELPGYDSLSIKHVLDLKSAKIELYNEYYDLLILDLNMPIEIGELPSMQAGAEFVDEIMETDKVKKPVDILVLSAFDESVQEFKKQVERAGFIVVPYNEGVQEWKDILKSRVSYLQLIREQRSYIPKPPHCDVLMITAVATETKAVLDLGYRWKEFQMEADSTVYRHTTIQANGKPCGIIHTQLSEMGMTAAAVHTTKAILRFNPQVVIMTGIAGGLEKDANIGDVLVATDVWNYNSGKYVEVIDGESVSAELRPDSKHILLNRAIRDKLTAINFKPILTQIKNSYTVNAPTSMLNVFYGPMACGSAVVASQDVIDMVRSQSRKVVGLDMESYGVYLACQEISNPPVNAIVLKSISDFADRKKDDASQDYAAYTSTSFAMHLIQNVLL